MARIIVEALADSGYAVEGNNEAVQIVMSISDSDGRPHTGLLSENFQVLLMYDTLTGEYAEVPPVIAEPIPGVYQFSFDNAEGTWSATPYLLIIRVTDERPAGVAGSNSDNGQAMVHFQVQPAR